MVLNVSDYLKKTASIYPKKPAFIDKNRTLTFSEVLDEAYHVASALLSIEKKRCPVIVFLDKSVECIPAFVGIAMSGHFYSPIDTEMPVSRIEKIVSTLEPAAVVTDRNHLEKAKQFAPDAECFLYEDMQKATPNTEAVDEATDHVLDSDLLYVLFTSGSTGVPKGVMISEQGVIDFVEWATDFLNVDDTFIFGNQTAFYFNFSIYEIYLTLKNGATTYIIPHDLFSYPGELMQYLHDSEINTLIWVPSALIMLSSFRALRSPYLEKLRDVWFGAESMPVKHLNQWMDNYPDVRFYNLFGPTEATELSAYKIDRRFEESDLLPIGNACRNKEILLLDENDQLVTEKGSGEICVRGRSIAYGYYNDPERTAEVFVQNPLNKKFREIIYRTGDIARFNDHGEMVYVCRKDFQIKHMGHRVELGEIESVATSLDGVDSSCCLYDDRKSCIVMFYQGKITEEEMSLQLKELLPVYMLPGKYNVLEAMPINLNGKIDRAELKKRI